ncbi:hypothetical protein ACF0H5_009080 [Mactra antiquata]
MENKERQTDCAPSSIALNNSPDIVTVYDSSGSFVLSGNTLKSESQIIDDDPRSSPDIFEKTRQRETEREKAQYAKYENINPLPENFLGVCEYDNFDFGSLLNENGANETANAVSHLLCSENDNFNTSTDFPTELLSGAFNQQCKDSHDNQISFYKCRLCNPTTYKDYADW